MNVPWSERIDAVSVTIDADAVDVERSAEEEARWFKRALQRPSADEEALVKDQFGWLGAQRFALGAVFFLMWVAAMAMLFVGPWAALLPFIVVAAWLVTFWIRQTRASGRAKSVVGHFTLRLDPVRLAVTSEGSPRCELALSAIARFDAAATLSAVTTDGARVKLPFALASRAMNEALAERLNDELVRVRSAGLYRGVGKEELVQLATEADEHAARKRE